MNITPMFAYNDTAKFILYSTKPRSTIFELTILLLILSGCSSSSQTSTMSTPTLMPGTGRVLGKLEIRAGQTSEPVKNAILYLGETLRDTAGNESVVSMDRVHSYRTATDNEGHFTFANIPPGNYGLVLDVIARSFLLARPESGDPMIIRVSAGIETNLGNLVYDSLPIFGQASPYPP